MLLIDPFLGIACLLAILVSMALLPLVQYEGMYVLAGATVTLGGFALLLLPRESSSEGEKRFVLNSRYRYYYFGWASARLCWLPLPVRVV